MVGGQGKQKMRMEPGREVKLRRYRRNHRMIPSLDIAKQKTSEKTEYTFVGEVLRNESRVYLTFDGEGNAKRFDWFSRDGDLDGDVQDGTPWHRRSRSIAHLRIGKTPSRRPRRMRLRDLPFPLAGGATDVPEEPSPKELAKKDIFGGSPIAVTGTVTAGSFGGVEGGRNTRRATESLDMIRAMRDHNVRMRRIGKPKWARSTSSILKRVAERAAMSNPDDYPMQRRRIEAFLKVLEHGEPESPFYLGDNDLLHPRHPWRVKGMQNLVKAMRVEDAPLRRQSFRVELSETLVKSAKKPGLGTFSGGIEIGGGKKLSADGPGIRAAVAKGAVIDDLGHIRCPIGSPGAMQFTNWQLEGCGKPSANKLRKAAYEAVSEADMATFLGAGGRTVSQTEIAKAISARQREAVTTATEMQINRRQVVSSQLQELVPLPGVPEPKGKKKLTKAQQESGLSSMLRTAREGRSKRVAFDLESGDRVGTGLAVARSEHGFSLNPKDLFDADGRIKEEGAAQVIQWLDAVIDLERSPGADRLGATLSHVDPPLRPRKPTTPPIKGRAQVLADQSGGDIREFKRLLDVEGYTVFDFETTGFDDGNIPVSVSAIRYVNGKEVGRKTIYMNPSRPLGKWSRDNLKNPDGDPLTDEWLADQPPLSEAMKELSDFIGDSILVAHNADFDLEVLDRSMADVGVKPQYSGSIDTLQLARQIVPKDRQKSHDLQSLKVLFGLDAGQWHDSESDSEAVSGILRGMFDHAEKNGFDGWILDGPEQARRFDKALATYDTERSAYSRDIEKYEETWGTKNAIVRLDVIDIFPDGGDSARKRNSALKKARDVADVREESAVIALSDGSVLELGRTPKRGLVTLERPTPDTAKMMQSKSILEASFARLEGADNMNLDGFTPDQVKDMMAEMRKIPGFEWIDPNNPDHLYLATSQGADRLMQLMHLATPEERDKWRMWYDGAHTYARDLSERYGISHESAVAVLAALSPTTDWDANMALAEHAIKLARDKDFKVNESLADELVVIAFKIRQQKIQNKNKSIANNRNKIAELQQQIAELSTRIGSEKEIAKLRKDIQRREEAIKKFQDDIQNMPNHGRDAFVGRSLTELDDDLASIVFAPHARSAGRSYIGQTYTGDPTKPKASSDGLLTYKMDVLSPNSYDITDGTDLARVQSNSNYLKVVRIIRADQDGKPNLDVIGIQIGKGSKVRSFYNNILRPGDTRFADTTGDTHYFGAATAVPVSSAFNVLDALFTTQTSTGAGRAYPIFRAMSVLAAARWNRDMDQNLLPREIQSITWEKIRQLVPTKFVGKDGELKKDATLKSFIVDAMTQVARVIGGPEGDDIKRNRAMKAFQREYAGREMELLSDLSSYLQSLSKDERAEGVSRWMKKFGLPELTAEERLPRVIKKKNGKEYEVDKEDGALLDAGTGDVVERAEEYE